MGVKKEIDKSRMMGTSAFKKEINHLLYSKSYTGSDGEFDAGWNCRDHALVMALMLKSGDTYPKIANGKCMFVQGPYSGNAAFGIGQEIQYTSGHNWVVHSRFGLIDVSPSLEASHHRFRASFDGIFNRVWLPQGKERTKVVVCDEPHDYEQEISKASKAYGHSTAVYMHLNDLEVTEKLIESPFKFLNSRFSTEIKKRFGSDFYPAVAKHLHHYMIGERNSLLSVGHLKAWGTVVDEFSA
ncbi:MAG: hypothetical protein WBN06_00580 [Lysobacterales bacterium]